MMMRALEKIAGVEAGDDAAARREIVCHRCGTCCLVPAHAPLDETVCAGCIHRLATPADGDPRRWPAVRFVADWYDRSAVSGPGYGVVGCPHCGAECVVEVGTTGRTACAVCIQPLGGGPLVRRDVGAHPGRSTTARDGIIASWLIIDDARCTLLPGLRP